MNLTMNEKEFLCGTHGNAAQKSMEILVALGEIYGAEKLVPVKSVQVAGVSYHNLGDAGLEYLEELAQDGTVLVNTTIPYSVEGLALALDTNKRTLNRYENDYKNDSSNNQKLSHLITCAKEKITKQRVELGLTGEFNPLITKMVLVNDGNYKDRQELEIRKESFNINVDLDSKESKNIQDEFDNVIRQLRAKNVKH